MAIRSWQGGLPSRAITLRLDDYPLRPEDSAWLSEKLGSDTPTFAALDKLMLSGTLSDDERKIIIGLQRAVRGEQRAMPGGVALHKDGVTAVDTVAALTTQLAMSPAGEPELLQKLRAHMPEGLWGHEAELEAFMRLAKDHVSEARLTPAVMSLVGEVGHGKDQAIEKLAELVCAEKPAVITVDMAGVSDRDVEAIFGEGAPLFIGELKKHAAAKSAIVRIVNADDLRTRAPKVCRALTERLLARRGEEAFAALPYVFDFNQAASESPRQLMVNALGAPGNRVLSATSTFEHLDADTMARYAQAVLPKILSARGLRGLTIELDGEALSALGRALATPHAPMDELEHRLLRLVLTHIDTQTSLRDAGDVVVRASVHPGLVINQTAFEQLIADLHTPAPDLFAAEQLFLLQRVAKRPDNVATREQILALTRRLGEIGDQAIMPLLCDLPEGSDELEARAAALLGAINVFRACWERMEKPIARREKLKLEALLSARDSETLIEGEGEVRAALAELEPLVGELLSQNDASGELSDEALARLSAVPERVREVLALSSRLLAALIGAASAEDLRALNPGPDYTRPLPEMLGLNGHASGCMGAVFSHDGATIASCSADSTIRFWDAKTGQAIGEPLKGHSGVVRAVAFSTDDKIVASVGTDGTLRLWDATSGAAIGKPLSSDGGWQTALAFGPDGKMLVTASSHRSIYLWDLTQDPPRARILGEHGAGVCALAISSDGRTLVSGAGNGELGFWDLAAQKELGITSSKHAGSVNALVISADGKTVISAGQDENLWRWDVASREPIGAAMTADGSGAIRGVSLSPDDSTIISCSDDKTLRRWDAKTGAAIGEPLMGHTKAVRSVAFNRDGRSVVSAGEDKLVILRSFAERSLGSITLNEPLAAEREGDHGE